MSRRMMCWTALVVVVVVIAGCHSGGDEGPPLGLDRGQWDGKWISSFIYINSQPMEEAYVTIAQQAGVTPEDVKRLATRMWQTDFGALELNGTQMTVYDMDTTTAFRSIEVTPQGTETVDMGGTLFTWHKFETDGSLPDYRYMVFGEVDGSGAFPQWTTRYDGVHKWDDLIHHAAVMLWWPQMVPEGTTAQEVADAVMSQKGVLDGLLRTTHDGKWVAGVTFIDTPELWAAFQQIADAAGPEYTADDVKRLFTYMWQSDAEALEFDGDMLTIYSMDVTTKALCAVALTYHGSESVPFGEGEELVWNKYESDGTCEGFRYIVISDVGKYNRRPPQFFARYDQKHKWDDLIHHPVVQMWISPFYPDGTTAQEIADGLGGKTNEFVAMVQHPDWSGKWVSKFNFLDDAAMEAAYQQIADEVGQGITPADVKNLLTHMWGSDFGALEMNGNAMTLCQADGTSVICNAELGYVGKETGDFGGVAILWHKFEATGGCPDYRYLVFTDIYAGPSFPEWYLRYDGQHEWDDLIHHAAVAMWLPNMVPEGTTAQQIADDLVGEAATLGELLTLVRTSGMPQRSGW